MKISPTVVHVWTFEEGQAALDCLPHAVRYVAAQFQLDMTRDQAMANMESRGILMTAYNDLLDEMEDAYLNGKAIKAEASA